MRLIAKRGKQRLLVEDDADPRDTETLGVIFDGFQAFQVPVQSAFARGYWDELAGEESDLLDGIEVIPWVRVT